MHIMDILCLFMIVGSIGFVVLIGLACLKMASEYDDISEEYWDEYWGKDEMQEKAQKKYEEYRRKFARDYGITLEQATEYQAVKTYKEYLEKEYKKHGVQICEKVGDA